MVESRGQRPVGISSAAVALLTVALWGGNPVAVQFCLETMPPLAIAAVRFAMAAAFMLFWCRATGSSLWLSRQQWKPAAVAGTLLFVQISLFNIGVAWTSTSHTTLLINTFIFWVVLIEHFVTRAVRFTGGRLIGLVLAAAGVVLALAAISQEATAQQRDTPTLFGDLVMLCSALVLGVKVVYTKAAVRQVEPGTLILWHDLVGVAQFTLASLIFERFSVKIDTPAVLGLLYQGLLVAGLCFVLQAMLLRRHSASQIAVFSFATPLVGITTGVLLRGDRPSPWLLAAGVLVAAGIMLVNLPQRAAAAPPPDAAPSSDAGGD